MSRRTVLKALRAHEGGYLSGEALSQQLGLSRAAVWKAVAALRKEGYTIEAQAGQGYRLTAAPDALTEPEIRSAMGETAVVGRKLLCFPELGSTNDYAKQLDLSGGEDGTVVVADHQTAGR